MTIKMTFDNRQWEQSVCKFSISKHDLDFVAAFFFCGCVIKATESNESQLTVYFDGQQWSSFTQKEQNWINNCLFQCMKNSWKQYDWLWQEKNNKSPRNKVLLNLWKFRSFSYFKSREYQKWIRFELKWQRILNRLSYYYIGLVKVKAECHKKLVSKLYLIVRMLHCWSSDQQTEMN